MQQESNPGHLRHRPAVLPRHPRKDSPEGSTFRRKKMIKFASHQVPINFIFLASAKVEKIHFLTQIFRFNFCVRCVTAVTRINMKPVFGKKKSFQGIFLRNFRIGPKTIFLTSVKSSCVVGALDPEPILRALLNLYNKFSKVSLQW